jgi:hypothetical protein
MNRPEGGGYDPETIELLRRVPEEAWQALSPQQRVIASKSELALSILRVAGQGEVDPCRLRERAVTGLFPTHREKTPAAPSVRRGTDVLCKREA